MSSRRCIRGVAIVCLSLFLLAGPSSASGFGPVTVYPADQGPICAFGTDVNGDGITDLLVVNNLSSDVSVLIGNSDGTFQQPVNYFVGVSPVSLAVSDFNGDTHLDLAVANRGSNSVSVLLGNGDGTFQPAVNYGIGTGTSPTSIVAAVFTFSGHSDLAVANGSGGDTGQGNVAILFGNGDGTFQSAVNLDTAGNQPVALASADFNSGAAGLAVVNFGSNDVTVFTSNEMGGFTIAGTFPVGGNGPGSISLWLFSNAVDLVVANSKSSNITILYETGFGTFNHSKTYPVGNMPVGVAWGVFNQNKYRTDIAVANEVDSTVTVFLAKEFKPYVRKPVTYATCSAPKSVSTAFISSQKFEDLVLACSNGVGVMSNTGP